MCPTGRTLTSTTLTSSSSSSDLRPAFDVLDADRDGKISKDDLRAFYAGFSSSGADESLIRAMMSAADSNSDGFVEYDEFERVLACQKPSAAGGVMEDVFKVMDRDGDGKLSHEDLKSYMNSAGFPATDDDIAAMIKLGGGDKTQGVDYAGLLKILAVDQVS
ncbi:calcium-binding protein CP1 [Rosa sericea]